MLFSAPGRDRTCDLMLRRYGLDSSKVCYYATYSFNSGCVSSSTVSLLFLFTQILFDQRLCIPTQDSVRLDSVCRKSKFKIFLCERKKCLLFVLILILWWCDLHISIQLYRPCFLKEWKKPSSTASIKNSHLMLTVDLVLNIYKMPRDLKRKMSEYSDSFLSPTKKTHQPARSIT